MNIRLDFVSLVLYAGSFIGYAANLYRDRRWLGRFATLLLILGLLTHYFALLARARLIHAVPYDDLYGSMSLFAWLVAFTYLGLEIYHRHRSVGSLVLPFVMLWLLAAVIVAPSREPSLPHANGPLFALHITIGIWSYAAFAISFLLSLIYLVQNRILRRGRPGLAFWRFPALDMLERMSRSSVLVGWVLLVVSTSLGFFWEHHLSGHFKLTDPKVLVTLLVLACYAGYLLIARAPSWRGSRAAIVCVLDFVLVLFSYTVVNVYLTNFHHYF